MQQLKSYLPSNATTTISDDLESIEIAVPLDDNSVDLSYPLLFGTFKTINNTWSANFVIAFLLLKNNNGKYVFEAETKKLNAFNLELKNP